ncbi:hypothetical protein B0T18DRAFT_399476 [Schizothecium vesticola]|uniref:Uncharacterized protein n=1 Tax=Schizothecium vesticola TaxID=314040 RepID=A0AA40FB77_9PEZI|nr:hypothetical protein B0T18DRAFT_399476 [Schizothecium vesticola]
MYRAGREAQRQKVAALDFLLLRSSSCASSTFIDDAEDIVKLCGGERAGSKETSISISTCVLLVRSVRWRDF